MKKDKINQKKYKKELLELSKIYSSNKQIKISYARNSKLY
jgi:hypothetical protein